MSGSGEFELGETERLPWLETVDDDYAEGPGILRTLLFVLIGLALVAAIVFGVYRFQQSQTRAGTGALIQAQEGDYKTRPDNPGGMKVEGEGDTVFATSEGKTDGNAAIDLKAMPEAPVAATIAPAAKPKPTANGSAAVPPSSGKLTMPPPVTAPAKATLPDVSSGALVQLGSFPSEATANSVWASMSKRLPYLAPLGKTVQQATVNGRTVYRLRVNAGSASAATALCAKLKVAGEACFVATS